MIDGLPLIKAVRENPCDSFVRDSSRRATRKDVVLGLEYGVLMASCIAGAWPVILLWIAYMVWKYFFWKGRKR